MGSRQMSRRKIKIILGSVAAVLSMVLLLGASGDLLAELYENFAVTICATSANPAAPGEPVTYFACTDVPPQMPTLTD